MTSSQRNDELGDVVPIPGVGTPPMVASVGEVEAVGPVLDGELLTDEQHRRARRRAELAMSRLPARWHDRDHVIRVRVELVRHVGVRTVPVSSCVATGRSLLPILRSSNEFSSSPGSVPRPRSTARRQTLVVLACSFGRSPDSTGRPLRLPSVSSRRARPLPRPNSASSTR